MRVPYVEQVFERLGVDFDYEPAFALEDFERHDHNQVRLETDKDKENRYAHKMAGMHPDAIEATWPAVVLNIIKKNRRPELVDGYHRAGASIKAGLKSFPAYVIAVESKAIVGDIAWELNEGVGDGATPRERELRVIQLYKQGDKTVQQISDEVHISTGVIGTIVAADHFMMRGRSNGFSVQRLSKLARGTKARLNTIKHDVVFKGLTKLAVEADLSESEVRDAIKQLDQATTEAAEVRAIADLREMFLARIEQTRAGYKATTLEAPRERRRVPITPMAEGWMHLNGLLKIGMAPKLADLSKLDDSKRAEYGIKYREGAKLLDEAASILGF